jgi:sugar phosphate isomerase/epimerase
MPRTWSWSTTGYTFTKRPHEEIIAVCVEVGLSGIEAVAELCGNRSEGELTRLGQEYKAAGLAIDSFHLPFSGEDDIASFYETIRRGAVERLGRHLEQAAALGARVVVQHPSTSRFCVQTEGLDRYLAAIERSLQALLPRAEALGLVIAVENMLPGIEGPRLGSAPQHFTELTARLGHPALGYCLDTGHALMAGGPEGQAAFLEAMGSRLVAFHLADNAGDRDSHLAPGRGLVDWRAVFRGMARQGYAHPACIETPPFAWGPHDTYGIEAWRGLVQETDALAAAVLAE